MKPQTKNKLLWQVPFFAFLLFGTIWILYRQANENKYFTNTGQAFGTTYHITYAHDEDVQQLIDQRLAKVNSIFSTFDEKSEISLVNKNERLEVSNEFVRIFKLAQQISNDTEGAFDITVAPLVNAWGFGFSKANSITPKQIDSIKQFVGYHLVELQSNKIQKKDVRTMLDCSAIAKGYGCDAVAQLLDSLGAKSYMVEIGGEIVMKGESPKQKPWRIGINKPVEDSTGVNNEVQTMLDLSNVALATSGNYRRYYVKGNRKYSHTIDPKTGYPVQHSILSATVIAKDCATADAFATAFMVMGFEKAKKVLQKRPELQAYFIYANEKGENQTWFSPNLQACIVE